MKNVQINIPDALIPFAVLDDERDRLVRNAMIIFPFIQNETISYGRAAEILGLPKIELINLYSSLGLPYFNQSESELVEDLKNIKFALEVSK